MFVEAKLQVERKGSESVIVSLVIIKDIVNPSELWNVEEMHYR